MKSGGVSEAPLFARNAESGKPFQCPYAIAATLGLGLPTRRLPLPRPSPGHWHPWPANPRPSDKLWERTDRRCDPHRLSGQFLRFSARMACIRTVTKAIFAPVCLSRLVTLRCFRIGGPEKGQPTNAFRLGKAVTCHSGRRPSPVGFPMESTDLSDTSTLLSRMAGASSTQGE